MLALKHADIYLLLVLLGLFYLQSNLAKVGTSDGKSKHIWIPFVRNSLILDTEYGNEHKSHAAAGMNSLLKTSPFYVQAL